MKVVGWRLPCFCTGCGLFPKIESHIHCWHTDDKFSKHAFMCGRYTLEDARDLDLGIVRDYCMAMSFRALGDLVPSAASLIRSALEGERPAAADDNAMRVADHHVAALNRVLLSASRSNGST